MGMQLRPAIWKAALTIIISLLGFGMALAASGDLDTTFSGDGKVTTVFTANWDQSLVAMAAQSDGKIVAVGERYDPQHFSATTRNFAVARYKTNGSLDTAFSGDGKQLTDFGGADVATDVAIQSNGKIVVSGRKCNTSGICDLAVARYNTNGSLDFTFSGDGKQVVVFGAGDNGSYGGLAIQSDGKILVGGYMTNASGDYDFAVYRLNTNGSLDTTFSGDGMMSFGFGPGRDDYAADLLLHNGKIIVAGSAQEPSSSDSDFALARLTSAGALDSTFSSDGKQTTNFGADELLNEIALQPDGKIVAAGGKYNTGSYFAVARYSTNGNLDTSFSGDGRAVFSVGNSGVAWASAVTVQPNGKIVVLGSAKTSSSKDFAVCRLNQNGALDATFSGDGKAVVNFSGNDDYGNSLLLQADGKYVLGGTTYEGTYYYFALARVLP